ncbi:MAG: hypothetical protein EA376_00805 [Phycisphaeraceae bacterium]|nr:MAG: hypothetical protein EA376_00805 [Phycisphaeraceae bacterium]
MKYEFRIVGTTPLFMNSDNIEWADQMEEWRKDPDNKGKSRPGDDRSPAFTWIGSLWNDGSRVTIPAQVIQKVISLAGAKVLTGKGKSTYKAVAAASVVCVEPWTPLLAYGKEIPMRPIEGMVGNMNFAEHKLLARKLGFELDVRRAKPQYNTKHVRVRPMFLDWGTMGVLDVDEDEISEDVMKKIMAIAGNKIGIGNWRPSESQSPGPFGKFEAELNPLKS